MKFQIDFHQSLSMLINLLKTLTVEISFSV